MFEVAAGKISLEQIEQRLKGEIREWPGNLPMATPNGLYLYDVKYDDESMLDSTDDVSKLPILPLCDDQGASKNPVDWNSIKHLMPSIFKIIK